MTPALRLTLCLLLLAAIAAGCGQPQPPAGAPSNSPAVKSLTSAIEKDVEKDSAEKKPSQQPPAATTDGGWGDVTGRFVLDGPAPAPVLVAHDKDVEVCGATSVNDELVVGKDGGIANVVVALYLKAGATKPAIHSSYDNLPAKVVLDNAKCQFVPHICVVRAGQTLVLKNSDPVGHNVNANGLVGNAPFNDSIAAGGSLDKPLDKAEKLPVTVQCSIHRWMVGYLVVHDHPYVAVSGTDGTFRIKNLPAGKWTLRIWQEKSGYVEDVTINGKAAKWAKGQVDITIDAAKPLDWGEIKVNPQAFADT